MTPIREDIPLTITIYGTVTTTTHDISLAIIADIPLITNEQTKTVLAKALYSFVLATRYRLTPTSYLYFFAGYCSNKAMALQCVKGITSYPMTKPFTISLGIPSITKPTSLDLTGISHDIT